MPRNRKEAAVRIGSALVVLNLPRFAVIGVIPAPGYARSATDARCSNPPNQERTKQYRIRAIPRANKSMKRRKNCGPIIAATKNQNLMRSSFLQDWRANIRDAD